MSAWNNLTEERVFKPNSNSFKFFKFFGDGKLSRTVFDDGMSAASEDLFSQAASYVFSVPFRYDLNESSVEPSLENKDTFKMTFPIGTESARVISCVAVNDEAAPFKSILKVFARNVEILSLHCVFGVIVGLVIILYKLHFRIYDKGYKSKRRIIMDSIWIVITIILLKQPKLNKCASVRLAVGFWKIACFVMVAWLAADVESNAIVRKRRIVSTGRDVEQRKSLKVFVVENSEIHTVMKNDVSIIWKGLKRRLQLKSGEELEKNGPEFARSTLCRMPSVLLSDKYRGRRFVKEAGRLVGNRSKFVAGGKDELTLVSPTFKVSSSVSKRALEQINLRIIRFRETRQEVVSLRKELREVDKYSLRETVTYKERSLNIRHFPEVFYTLVVGLSVSFLAILFEEAY